MLIWCGYCHRFMENIAPFSDLKVSHGVCASCFKLVHADEFDYQAAQALADFFEELWRGAKTGRSLDLASTLKRAAELHIRPLDLFVGILQPQLRQIGQLFEENRIKVIQEHQFTAFCEEVIAAVNQATTSQTTATPPAPSGSGCVLACIPGNTHRVGLQIVDFFFRQQGVATSLLPAGASLADIVDAARALPATAIGLSVALPEQLPRTVNVARELSQIFQIGQGPSAPRIIVGGAAVCDRHINLPGVYCHHGSLENAAKILCTGLIPEARSILDK